MWDNLTITPGVRAEHRAPGRAPTFAGLDPPSPRLYVAAAADDKDDDDAVLRTGKNTTTHCGRVVGLV